MSASREVLLFEIFWKGLLTSKMAVFPTLFYSLVPTFLYTQACSLKNIPLSSRASLCSPLEPEYPFPAGETVKKKLKLCLDCSNVAQNAFLDSFFFFSFVRRKFRVKLVNCWNWILYINSQGQNQFSIFSSVVICFQGSGIIRLKCILHHCQLRERLYLWNKFSCDLGYFETWKQKISFSSVSSCAKSVPKTTFCRTKSSNCLC